MKNRLSVKVLALVLCIVALSANNAMAQSPYSTRPQLKFKLYSGPSVLPYFATGFRDAHLTEFPEYPIFTPGEFRVGLPLSQGASSSLRLGGLLGLEVSNLGGYDRLSFLFEIQGMPGENSRYFNFAAGFGYNFIDFKRDFKQDLPLTVGLVLKGGYAFGLSTFATVNRLPDRPFVTSVVDRDGGVFQVGDRLQSDIFGATLQIAVKANYEIVRNVDVGIQLGYSGAWLGAVNLISTSGGSLNPLSPNVVNADISDPSRGFARAFDSAPTVSLNGFFAALNFGLTFF